MFGLFVRFTCKDEAAAEAYDKLVAQTIEAIKANEPGTLVYASHLVEGQPLQRIGGLAGDQFSCGGAPGKADHANFRMGEQFVTHGLGIAGEHLHALRRQACIEQDFAKPKHGQRTLLRQFHNHRTSGC